MEEPGRLQSMGSQSDTTERLHFHLHTYLGFPGGSVAKNLLANAGDVGLIPGSGRSPGERNCNPLQDSCLENHMGRGARRARVHGVTKESDMTEQLNNNKQRTRISEKFKYVWPMPTRKVKCNIIIGSPCLVSP